MEQPVYLLLGAGALIILAAFFIKNAKPANRGENQTHLVQKQMERAEMEAALQRFVHQIKQENDAMLSDLDKEKSEVTAQIASLRQRLEKNEAELSHLTKMVSAREQQNRQPDKTKDEHTQAETDKDILALRERYRRVFELKQEGFDLDEIAKRLGAGRGEIELIFSLATPSERGKIDG